MKIHLFLLFALSLSLSTCQKEKLGSTHPMVGRWQLESQVFEDVNSICQNEITAPASLKNLVMEITADGNIIPSLDGKTQKLKIIEIVENTIFVNFYKNQVTNYRCTCRVKDKKGNIFIFKFFFDENHAKMIGTFWTPNQNYMSKESPNLSVITCYSGPGHTQPYSTVYVEKYAKFIKL
jgi:hypothetical protein